MFEISEFCLLLEEPATDKDKGSSGCFGRGGYGTFPIPEDIALRADKTWARYYFG